MVQQRRASKSFFFFSSNFNLEIEMYLHSVCIYSIKDQFDKRMLRMNPQNERTSKRANERKKKCWKNYKLNRKLMWACLTIDDTPIWCEREKKTQRLLMSMRYAEPNNNTKYIFVYI